VTGMNGLLTLIKELLHMSQLRSELTKERV